MTEPADIERELAELRRRVAELEARKAAISAEGERSAAISGDVGGDVVTGTKIIQQLPSEPVARREALERAYLQRLARECNRLQLGAIDPKYVTATGESKIGLADVSIALNTTVRVPEGRDPRLILLSLVDGLTDEWPEEMLEERRPRGPGAEMKPVSALVAADVVSRLVLLGDPGSGKLTFVNHLAFCLARARLESNGSWLERFGEWQSGKLLPVRVTLRDFAAWGVAHPEFGWTAPTLTRTLAGN